MREQEIESIFPEAHHIRKPDLRTAVFRAWLLGIEKGGWHRIDTIPFTLLIPGCGISLVQHTRIVTRMAMSIGDTIGEVNTDYLVAGGLTHDVGKLLEYQGKGKEFQRSEIGRLIRHPVSGYALAVEAGLPLEVCHIIAAHSSEGESVERSKEAIIIHHCDFIHFEIVKSLT
ncbi:hypothetical protein AMJ40_01795 [candidate division TA06 bacterium DG_26]|uniref:HD domain-containing protein n=1 Tax=candidate division TA06 bacterium DG_26 TaxID=1703771 RepID=A0A0S7WMH5_UNCT6|nr:MAG: hypothetical protein AMJ40_01795 [candidate division TA06 bacterium DG_26]